MFSDVVVGVVTTELIKASPDSMHLGSAQLG